MKTFPVAVDEKTATFAYVDPGLTTDSELRAWGKTHAPLWAALRARTFAVQIVAIGAGEQAADRAEKVLRCWTREGDRQAEATPAGKTQADPEVQQELAELERAIVQVDRKTLQALGGVGAASRRLLTLGKLPAGTTPKANPRGSIDRYQPVEEVCSLSRPVQAAWR